MLLTVLILACTFHALWIQIIFLDYYTSSKYGICGKEAISSVKKKIWQKYPNFLSFGLFFNKVSTTMAVVLAL